MNKITKGTLVTYHGAYGTIHGIVIVAWGGDRTGEVVVQWASGTTYGGGEMTVTNMQVDELVVRQ